MDWIWQPLIGNLAVSALTISVWLHVKRHLRDCFAQFFPVIFGALLGLGAVITMVMTIQVQPGVFFDLRSSLVGVAALFGGPLAGVIALLPPLAYRLYLGGQGATAGASLIIASGVFGLIGHYWSANKPVRFSTALLLASAIASVTLISIGQIPSIAAEGRWLTIAAPIFLISLAATTVAGYFLIVAETEAAEREIAEAAFIQAPDFAYVKNRASQFVAVNKTTAAFHGFNNPQQMLGLTDFDLMDEARASKLYAAEQQAMQELTSITNMEELIVDKEAGMAAALSRASSRWHSDPTSPLDASI